MSDDLEPSPEDEARWARNLLKPKGAMDKLSAASAAEQKMIAAVLGTKTAAEHFLRNTSKPSHAQAPAKRYRPVEVTVRYDYFDRPDSDFALGGWTIERFENGRRTSVQTGTDYRERDDILIRYAAGGFTCKPIVVADRAPIPIEGRRRDQAPRKSAKTGIMARIGKLTSDDIAFDQENEY